MLLFGSRPHQGTPFWCRAPAYLAALLALWLCAALPPAVRSDYIVRESDLYQVIQMGGSDSEDADVFSGGWAAQPSWGEWAHSGCECTVYTSENPTSCINYGPPVWSHGAGRVETLGCELFGAPEDRMGDRVHLTPLTRRLRFPFFGLKGGTDDVFNVAVSGNGFVSLVPHGMVRDYTAYYTINSHLWTEAEWPLIALWLTDLEHKPGTIRISHRRYHLPSNSTPHRPTAACDESTRLKQLRCLLSNASLPTNNETSLPPTTAAAVGGGGGGQEDPECPTLLDRDQHDTGRSNYVDSLLVDYVGCRESAPVRQGLNLTAQVELFTNGTIMMRYNYTPSWPANKRQIIPITGLILSPTLRQMPGPVNRLPPLPTEWDRNLSYRVMRFEPRVSSPQSIDGQCAAGVVPAAVDTLDACAAATSCAECTQMERRTWPLLPPRMNRTSTSPDLGRIGCHWCDGGSPSSASNDTRGRCVSTGVGNAACPLRFTLVTSPARCARYSTTEQWTLEGSASTATEGAPFVGSQSTTEEQDRPAEEPLLRRQAVVGHTLAADGEPRRYQWRRSPEIGNTDWNELFSERGWSAASRALFAKKLFFWQSTPRQELNVTVANSSYISVAEVESGLGVEIRAPLSSKMTWRQLPANLATVDLPFPVDAMPYRPTTTGSPLLRCPPSTRFNVTSQGDVYFETPGAAPGNLSNASYRHSPDAMLGRGTGGCGAGVAAHFGFNPYMYCTNVYIGIIKARSYGDPFCTDGNGAIPHVNGSSAGGCPDSVLLRWTGCLFNNQTATEPDDLRDADNAMMFQTILHRDGRGAVQFPTGMAGSPSNVTTGYGALGGYHVSLEAKVFPLPGETPQHGTWLVLGYELQPDYTWVSNNLDMVAPGMQVEFAPVEQPCSRCANGHQCNFTSRQCECPPPTVPPRCVSCRPSFYYSPGTAAWPEPHCERCPNCLNGGQCDGNTGECVCPAAFYGRLCEVSCTGTFEGPAAGNAALANFTARSSCEKLQLQLLSPAYSATVTRAFDMRDAHVFPDRSIGEGRMPADQPHLRDDGDLTHWVPTPSTCSPHGDVDLLRTRLSSFFPNGQPPNATAAHSDRPLNLDLNTTIDALTEGGCHRVADVSSQYPQCESYVSNVTLSFNMPFFGIRGGAVNPKTNATSDSFTVAVSACGYINLGSTADHSAAATWPRIVLWDEPLTARNGGNITVFLQRRRMSAWLLASKTNARGTLPELGKQLRQYATFGSVSLPWTVPSGVETPRGSTAGGGPWLTTLVVSYENVTLRSATARQSSSSGAGHSANRFTGQLELFPDGSVAFRYRDVLLRPAGPPRAPTTPPPASNGTTDAPAMTPAATTNGAGSNDLIGLAYAPANDDTPAGSVLKANLLHPPMPVQLPTDASRTVPSYRFVLFEPNSTSPAIAAMLNNEVLQNSNRSFALVNSTTNTSMIWEHAAYGFGTATHARSEELAEFNRSALAQELFALNPGLAAPLLTSFDPCEAFPTCATCVTNPRTILNCAWCDGAAVSPITHAMAAADGAEDVNPRWDLTGRCMSAAMAKAFCPATPALTTIAVAIARGCPSNADERGSTPLALYAQADVPYRQSWHTSGLTAAAAQRARDPQQLLARERVDLTRRPFPTGAEAIATYVSYTTATARIDITLPFDVTLFPAASDGGGPSPGGSSSSGSGGAEPFPATATPAPPPQGTARQLTAYGNGIIILPGVGSIAPLHSTFGSQGNMFAAVLPERRRDPAAGCFTWGATMNASDAPSSSSSLLCSPAVLIEWHKMTIAGWNKQPMTSRTIWRDGVNGTRNFERTIFDTSYLDVRALIESSGNITFAYGSAGDVFDAGLLPSWASAHAPVIGLFQPEASPVRMPHGSGGTSSTTVPYPAAVLSAYTSVMFTPTRRLPCVPACTGNLRCDLATGTCSCPSRTVLPNCTQCPAGTVYTPGTGSVPASCAQCPDCENGGVCVESSPGRARCICPVNALGERCEHRCPVGRLASETCATVCEPAEAECRCGVCFCNATQFPACPGPEAAPGLLDSTFAKVALVAVGAAIIVLCFFALKQVRRYRRRRAAEANANPVGLLPPPPADDVAEPGGLDHAIAGTSPMLLARLVAHSDPALAERAGELHAATTNPLGIMPRRTLPGQQQPTGGGGGVRRTALTEDAGSSAATSAARPEPMRTSAEAAAAAAADEFELQMFGDDL